MVCEGEVCGIDTETEPIKNHYEDPALVLFGACSGHKVQLCEWQYFPQYQSEFLAKNPHVKFAFFNGPFDQRVMGPDVWIPELNKENRVMEIQAAYPAFKVSTIGWFAPGFTLELVTNELFGVQLDKDEEVRLGFRRDKPITDRQYIYMVFDAISTCKDGEVLQGQPTESIQARAAYVLSEISHNGMLMDVSYVERQQAMWYKVLEEEGNKLKSFGYPVKTFWSDYTGMEFMDRIADNVGIPAEDVRNILGDRRSLPQWWWQALALTLYGHILNKSPISTIRAALRDLLVLPSMKLKASVMNKYKEEVRAALRQLMREIGCLECLDGVGENPVRPKGSGAWKVLALISSETFADARPDHNYMRDVVHEELRKEFQELHEQNRGWLKDYKPLSQTKFLQEHIRQLRAQYPTLQLKLTDAAKKNINELKVAEAKAAKKEKREQRKVDTSALEVWQVTGKEAWRFKDAGIDDPFLNAYWKFKHAEKMLSTYVTLKYVEDDGRVHPRFTGFLKTGRTGCSSPLKVVLYYMCDKSA